MADATSANVCTVVSTAAPLISLILDCVNDSVAITCALNLGAFALKFQLPVTVPLPAKVAPPFTVSEAMVAVLVTLAVATFAVCTVALVAVMAEIAAVGITVVPVNTGLALGTFSAFNVASVATRASISLPVTRVASTTPDSRSVIVSFSTTSSSMSVPANALAPMCVTLAGMVKRPLNFTPLNALSPMRTSALDKTSGPSANSVRPLNAPFAISTTANAFSEAPYPLYASVPPA